MTCKTDMHLHTYYSDGVFSPAEIVRRAKDLGYSLVSITDHDGTDGLHEAITAAEELGGIKVIPGIELSAQEEFIDSKTSVHILGYGIDQDNGDLVKALVRIRANRDERNEKLVAALKLMGYDIDIAELRSKIGGYTGKPDIARLLLKKGYIRSADEAFRPGMILESPEIKAIKKEKPDAKHAIGLIVNSGGTAVLAHPVKIKRIGERGSLEFYDNLERLIVRLTGYGLKGIECYHTEHSEKEALKLVELAEKYNLQITEGSDYHGD